jgi:hypothetical protein
MQLHPYQLKALAEISHILSHGSKVVLASCPGSGKTTMALLAAKPYLEAGQNVLVLTHGTHVIKTQWAASLAELGDEPLQSRVTLAIPQEIKTLLSSKTRYSLVIVDEAHEFYLAGRENNDTRGLVKEILEAIQPEKELLLTGTPSKFLAANEKEPGSYPIVVVDGITVYREGQLQNASIGLVQSRYDIKAHDYTTSGELKPETPTSESDSNGTVEAVLEELIKLLHRHKVLGQAWSSNNALFRPVDWVSRVFCSLDKTLIACRNIKQAQHVYQALVSRGVGALVSDSDADPDSACFRTFKEDPAMHVLVVVRRGILGFNFPELCNVIDMTGSRNIDRIYQLYARVLRKHPKENRKFYVRVCPLGALEYAHDSFYLQAALSLMSSEYLSRYTGVGSLPKLEIPVPERQATMIHEYKEASKKEGKKTQLVTLRGLEYQEILDLELLSELTDLKTEVLVPRATACFGDVTQILTGKGYHDGEGTKKAILERCSQVTNKSEFVQVKRLGFAWSNISNPKNTNKRYDPSFTSQVLDLYPWMGINLKGKGRKKS